MTKQKYISPMIPFKSILPSIGLVSTAAQRGSCKLHILLIGSQTEWHLVLDECILSRQTVYRAHRDFQDGATGRQTGKAGNRHHAHQGHCCPRATRLEDRVEIIPKYLSHYCHAVKTILNVSPNKQQASCPALRNYYVSQ